MMYHASLIVCLMTSVVAAQDQPRPEVPDGVMQRARLHMPAESQRLGFSAEDLSSIGRDTHVLRTVLSAMSDVRAAPNLSARFGDELLAAGGNSGALVRTAFLLTDVAAARTVEAPIAPLASWAGFEGVAKEASAIDAIRSALAPDELAAEDARVLERLPREVLELVAGAVVSAVEAERWMYPEGERIALSSVAGLGYPWVRADREKWYTLAAAPWVDERHGRMVTNASQGLRLLGAVDRGYLAYGASVALLRLNRAVADFSAWQTSEAGRAAIEALGAVDLRISTSRGELRIAGTSTTQHLGEAWIVIDLGGDDTYDGLFGTPLRPGDAGLVIDAGGDDRYGQASAKATLACGLFGLGAIIDLGGDDQYECGESGLACGWYGVGVLVDHAGNDSYSGRIWTQAAAHAGVGVLADLSGNDSYVCDEQSQGMGSTLGCGALIDQSGNDSYVARDEGNVSAAYLNQSVAMSQGCGYGRRADTGDGHSLAGGFGLLIDGAGDDSYHAQVWAQGCGYWWGVGLLDDRSGNDRYRNGKYSAGAAAHFAVGCLVDGAGNDVHNAGPVDNPTAKNQYLGHARDWSIGVFLDGGGDDQYMLRTHCAGSADLASFAVFADLGGDDVYIYRPPVGDEIKPADGWNDTPPLGSATQTRLSRGFRRNLPAIGVFFDQQGKDTYPNSEVWANGKEWLSKRDSLAVGVGVDIGETASKSP